MGDPSHIYTKLIGEHLDKRLLQEFPLDKIVKYRNAAGYNANWTVIDNASEWLGEKIDRHLNSLLSAKARLIELGATEFVVHITIMDSVQGNTELSVGQVQKLAQLGAALATTVVYAKDS